MSLTVKAEQRPHVEQLIAELDKARADAQLDS